MHSIHTKVFVSIVPLASWAAAYPAFITAVAGTLSSLYWLTVLYDRWRKK